jgi:hypothetical protein
MKGYIYTLFAGADPTIGWTLNDPIFKPIPTLGICMPNIRRVVEPGDFVFAVSGRVEGLRQYVVGGFEVAEKISAIDAHMRFPENRLRNSETGQTLGNIIVDARGRHHKLDSHDNFLRRIDNYLVGCNAIEIGNRKAEKARVQTLPVLRRTFGRDGNRVFDIIGRNSRLDAEQVKRLTDWLGQI